MTQSTDSTAQDLADPHQQRICATQIRSVYMHFTPALLGTTLAAFFLVVLQWPVIESDNLLLWLILFIGINLFRSLLVFRFVRLNPDDAVCCHWGRRFFISSLLAGLIWAMGVVIAFPPDNLTYQLTLTVIIIGLGAGATSTISMVMASFIVFVFPMMFTLMTMFFIENHYTANIIAVAIGLTLLFVTRGAKNIYDNHLQNIRLQIQAEVREEALINARNEAQKANLAKSEFLANMSHELRTPLHGILSYAKFGIDKLGMVNEEKLAKYFTQINASGMRLKILLDDLLDLSKLEAGKMVMDIHQTSLTHIVSTCVNEQEALLEKCQLTIHYDYATNLSDIDCDENRIGQVIMNLLSNAIKFSPSPGCITLRAQETEINNINGKAYPAIKFSIIDQGPGVPDDEKELIFRKFLQSSKTYCAEKGTGLGLAICKEIIDAHQGRIWCEDFPIQGAVFSFLLPRQQPQN